MVSVALVHQLWTKWWLLSKCIFFIFFLIYLSNDERISIRTFGSAAVQLQLETVWPNVLVSPWTPPSDSTRLRATVLLPARAWIKHLHRWQVVFQALPLKAFGSQLFQLQFSFPTTVTQYVLNHKDFHGSQLPPPGPERCRAARSWATDPGALCPHQTPRPGDDPGCFKWICCCCWWWWLLLLSMTIWFCYEIGWLSNFCGNLMMDHIFGNFKQRQKKIVSFDFLESFRSVF